MGSGESKRNNKCLQSAVQRCLKATLDVLLPQRIHELFNNDAMTDATGTLIEQFNCRIIELYLYEKNARVKILHNLSSSLSISAHPWSILGPATGRCIGHLLHDVVREHIYRPKGEGTSKPYHHAARVLMFENVRVGAKIHNRREATRETIRSERVHRHARKSMQRSLIKECRRLCRLIQIDATPAFGEVDTYFNARGNRPRGVTSVVTTIRVPRACRMDVSIIQSIRSLRPSVRKS